MREFKVILIRSRYGKDFRETKIIKAKDALEARQIICRGTRYLKYIDLLVPHLKLAA